MGALRQDDSKVKGSLSYIVWASLGNLVIPCLKIKVERELGIQFSGRGLASLKQSSRFHAHNFKKERHVDKSVVNVLVVPLVK